MIIYHHVNAYNDHPVYNTTIGALSYDTNGNGVGGFTQFALLNGAPSISATDFLGSGP